MTGRAWGRLLRRGLLALLVLGIGFSLWARLFAGGPVSLIPGGSLRGELVTEPILDWSIAGSTQYVDVESRARWLPYSSATWFMVLDGDLFIFLPRLFGTGLEQLDFELAHPSVWSADAVGSSNRPIAIAHADGILVADQWLRQ